MDVDERTKHFLDLRGVACPLNFVKTKLFLNKLSSGAFVTVILDEGEPLESVSASLLAEGHRIVEQAADAPGCWRLCIQKT
jgi:TusA-related sulfurtransferase